MFTEVNSICGENRKEGTGVPSEPGNTLMSQRNAVLAWYNSLA
jgi:hypothetical protein